MCLVPSHLDHQHLCAWGTSESRHTRAGTLLSSAIHHRSFHIVEGRSPRQQVEPLELESDVVVDPTGEACGSLRASLQGDRLRVLRRLQVLEMTGQAREDLGHCLVDPRLHPGLIVNDTVDAAFRPTAPNELVAAWLHEVNEQRALVVNQRSAIVIGAYDFELSSSRTSISCDTFAW
jgi:hypothetical protein